MEECRVLEADQIDVLNFFHEGLRRKALAREVHDDEIIYVADVLTKFSRSSHASSQPNNLTDVYTQFLLRPEKRATPDMLEYAGARILFLTGFFRRSEVGRLSNVRWYEETGSFLYRKASRLTGDYRRGKTFQQISAHFSVWAEITSEFAECCQRNGERRYLLRLQ